MFILNLMELYLMCRFLQSIFLPLFHFLFNSVWRKREYKAESGVKKPKSKLTLIWPICFQLQRLVVNSASLSSRLHCTCWLNQRCWLDGHFISKVKCLYIGRDFPVKLILRIMNIYYGARYIIPRKKEQIPSAHVKMVSLLF